MIVVLDTETSGHLGNKLSSVIEVGAVVLTEKGIEIGTFSSLVKPTQGLGGWSKYAFNIHKIDPDLVMAAAPADQVWEALLSWMSLHAPVTAVLAFNVPFDRGMMKKTFPASEHLPWGDCLMRRTSMAIQGNRKSISLMNACAALGVYLPERADSSQHRALFDATLAGRCHAMLIERGAS